MPITITEDLRIGSIEKKLNELQSALNKVATKAQLKQLLNIRQSEINDIQDILQTLDTSGVSPSFIYHKTDAAAHAEFDTRYVKTNIFTTAVDVTGPSTNVSIIPAGTLVLGVFITVNTTVTGATGIDVGVVGSTQRYGTNISVDSSTTSNLTNFINDTPVTIFSSPTDVILTAVGSNFISGNISVTVHCITL
jgi:hypothetical protein